MGRASTVFTVAFLLVTIGTALAVPRGDLDLTPWRPTVTAAPGSTVGLAIHVTGGEDAPPVQVDGYPEDWTVVARTVQVRGTGTALVTVSVPRDAGPGAHRIELSATQGLATARAVVSVDVAELASERARAGAGVRLTVAGAFDDGTLFYANDRTVLASTLPRAFDGGRPFPLEVWLGAGDGDVPEPYASAGYARVVPGLEAALIGMRPGETRVVRVPAALAYTTPEQVGHPLYGQALTFLATVDEVVVYEGSSPLPVGPFALDRRPWPSTSL